MGLFIYTFIYLFDILCAILYDFLCVFKFQIQAMIYIVSDSLKTEDKLDDL